MIKQKVTLNDFFLKEMIVKFKKIAFTQEIQNFKQKIENILSKDLWGITLQKQTLNKWSQLFDIMDEVFATSIVFVFPLIFQKSQSNSLMLSLTIPTYSKLQCLVLNMSKIDNSPNLNKIYIVNQQIVSLKPLAKSMTAKLNTLQIWSNRYHLLDISRMNFICINQCLNLSIFQGNKPLTFTSSTKQFINDPRYLVKCQSYISSQNIHHLVTNFNQITFKNLFGFHGNTNKLQTQKIPLSRKLAKAMRQRFPNLQGLKRKV